MPVDEEGARPTYEYLYGTVPCIRQITADEVIDEINFLNSGGKYIYHLCVHKYLHCGFWDSHNKTERISVHITKQQVLVMHDVLIAMYGLNFVQEFSLFKSAECSNAIRPLH